MNFPGHIMLGLLSWILFLLISTFVFSVSFSPVMIVISLLITLYASIFPDVDTVSVARYVTDILVLLLIIGSAVYSFSINNYGVLFVCSVLSMLFLIVFPRACKHRGLYHSWILGIILSVLICVLVVPILGISFMTGFVSHKFGDWIPNKIDIKRWV